MKNVEKYLTLISTGLSFLGSLIIIVLNLVFADYRKNFFRKLVFHLSIYDFINSFLFFIPGSQSNFCKYQAHLLVFTCSMPCYIALSISLITYLNISKNWPVYRLEKLARINHIISLIIAAALTVYCAFYSGVDLDEETYWCFISNRYSLGIYYCIIWACCLFSTIFYLLIINKIRIVSRSIKELMNYEDKKNSRETLLTQIRMSIIPLALIFTWIFPSIRRSREIFYPGSKQITIINILQGLTNPLQGFLDCIVFVFCSSYSRSKLKKIFCCSYKSEKVSVSFVGASKKPLLLTTDASDSQDNIN
ncbi:g protein-coupled receptor [Anaeramoeba flamelloides]|uniref:G protein-coupled receptor n=1 Tax=Anaeramoeba flamelloides TaxID=1746091 RepID=A0ABQ8Y1J0_9EUKA|nr:g protein-coupled receptor [Anaeramoeba flamelloides]